MNHQPNSELQGAADTYNQRLRHVCGTFVDEFVHSADGVLHTIARQPHLRTSDTARQHRLAASEATSLLEAHHIFRPDATFGDPVRPFSTDLVYLALHTRLTDTIVGYAQAEHASTPADEPRNS